MTIDADVADVSQLTPSLRLAAHRVLTETLTNAAKHQDHPHVTVRVQVGAALVIDVVSTGRLISGATGNNIGLESLAEQCVALGGSFDFALHEDAAVTHATIPMRT
ncbi:MAG: hypothetical protein Q4A82_06125 [Corynebacterium sp.]|nr:hypothetical protein [Corynebacterium sp.]